MGKHYRQDLGFDGLNVEMKQRAKIELDAKTIPPDDITEFELDDEPGQFAVQSQSNPDYTYHVDIISYTCDCPVFPLVSYCKHLAAVSLHYYDEPENQPLENLWTRAGTPPNIKPSCVPIPEAPSTQTAEQREELAILALIPEKLQRLAVRTQLAPPQQLTPTLRQLDGLLDRFMAEYAQPQVLPMPKKIAPNPHSWLETKAVMGVDKKGKRKRTHTDAYSGGEKSGKKAKGDAKVPLVVPRTALYVHLFFSRVLLLIDHFSPSFVSANTMTNAIPSDSSHHTRPSHNDENACPSYTPHNIPRPSSYYPFPTSFAPRYSPPSHIQPPDHTDTYTTYTHPGYP